MIVLQRRTHQHLRNINKNPWSEIPYWGTVTTMLGSFIFTKAGQARHDHIQSAAFGRIVIQSQIHFPHHEEGEVLSD